MSITIGTNEVSNITIGGTTVSGVYVGSEKVRPSEVWTYEEYTFSNGSPVQTGWTTANGSFKAGSQGSGWITAGRGSTACRMYRSAGQWGKFKVQHRCYANPLSWGGGMTFRFDGNSRDANATGFRYSLTTTSGYVGQCLGVINGVNYTEGGISATSLASGIYIDEIVYDGTNATINLYKDNNGQPGTLLYTCTGPFTNNATRFWLYHEHGSTPYSQTNRVRVWHT